MTKIRLHLKRLLRRDDRMIALVCPQCHRVRYFPYGTNEYEEQPDGLLRRRVCDKCSSKTTT